MRKNIFNRLCFLVCSLLLLTGCKEDEISTTGSEDGNNPDNELFMKLTPVDYNSANTYYLLNDDEPSEVYFNGSQRSFYVTQPLQLTFDDDHYFQLLFYSPRKLSNVTIWAKIDGYKEAFRFMELEEIRPFQQLRIHVPFATKDLTAYTHSGKKIQIMANPYLTGENLSFEIECDDPYYKKLQSIRCKWRISFGGYSGTGAWQYKLLPPHAREGVALALNLSYMYSSEEFEKALHEFGPLHSDANKTVINKNVLLNQAINHSGFHFGHCSGVNGLGGGETYGLTEWCYLEHYADDTNETHTVFHELAHCLGYGHDGNMTYEQTGTGWITLCADVYRSLSLNKELPVYSRRFMHTRKNKNRYDKNNLYWASKYIIEDPELDAIDGGLSPLREETDLGGNDGEPVSFRLDYTALPGATSATFRPKDVYVYGDTLYVVNDADNNYSLEVFSMAKSNIVHLGSIREWTEKNATRTFGGRPNGVVRANDRIYVTHEGSRTEIFDAKNHRFITCIGNGNWGTGSTQTVHAFDAVLYKGVVMIRDKRYVDFVQERTVAPGETMFVFARSENLGEESGTYGMAVDERTNLLYSTHPSKRIDILAPDNIREGTTLARARQLAYKNNPYALGFYQERMFVSSNGNEKFCDVNPETGDIIKNHTVIGSITLQAPEKFCIRRNTLFITDRIKNGACVYAIPMNELK